MSDVAQDPKWDARQRERDIATAEAKLKALVDQISVAMSEAAALGVNVQGVMMEMMTAAFAAENQEVPPLLKMLLGS